MADLNSFSTDANFLRQGYATATSQSETIARLAFQDFLAPASDQLTQHFSPFAIEAMGRLRALLKSQLSEKSATAEAALAQAYTGDRQAISIVSNFLEVEMLADETFASQLQQLADAVQAGKLTS